MHRFAVILMVPTLMSACGDGDRDSFVNGDGEGIGRMTQALTSGELESANGSYGVGCTSRTGNWSVEIASGAALDHAALSVITNDTACTLRLTGLRTTGGLLAADPVIVLTDAYKAAASEFGSPTIEFYANAKLSSVSFSSDFTLTVLYSDDPELATASKTANWDVVEATAVGESVPAPDYTLALTNLSIYTDVDHVVQSVSGTADLTLVTVAGQTYVVTETVGLATYADIDAAYQAGTPAALVTAIPAADFTLAGEDLTPSVKRSLIIANTSNDVPSYKVFEITFNPPS